MTKKDNDIKIEDVTDKTTEESISSFAKLTQEDTAVEAKQWNNLFSQLSEWEERLVPFKKKQIRSIFHENSWWFSVVDVIESIAETDRPTKYWSDLKKKLESEGFTELSEKIGQLKLTSKKDWKKYMVDCIDTETLFRLIQSIPSKNAEPFKRWLAKVWYERILETQDPEIAIKRAMTTYRAKWYSDEWVNTRIQTISSRKELTNEWKKRGVKEWFEFAVLTDAISQETFDLKTQEHKELKGLWKQHNLRDHMSSLELALVMLWETTTAELAKTQNSQGFEENEKAAKMWGKIAGWARKNIESKLGRSVVSNDNFLKNWKQKIG